MKPLWSAFIYYQQLKERLLPRPFERIALSGRKNLVGAEIGVLRGEHARNLLRTASIQKLFLVDPYIAYSDYSQAELDRSKSAAKSKLRRFRARIQWIHSDSISASRLDLPPLDFVYLDAGHDLDSVRNDIQAWWTHVDSGGILGGHDFCNGGDKSWTGVTQAVIEFAVHNQLKLFNEISDWWIIKP